MNIEPRFPSQDEIAIRAYFLWQNAGCPDGREFEFWLSAEEELTQNARAKPAPKAEPALPSRGKDKV